MKVGDLKLFTTGPEDKVKNITVYCNESVLGLEEFDINSLTSNDHISGFKAGGEGIDLTEFLDSFEALTLSLDAEKQVIITGRYKDSSLETKEYELIVTLDIEEEEIEIIESENE